MSAEQQQDQRPKSSASSKKSVTRKSEDNQQRGHQLSDDGPVAPAAGAAGGNADAYQQLSDDQPETSSENGEQKADKPKKENPLKKFIASLKSLNCTGKPANFDKKGGNKDGEKNGDEDDDENIPNARPVSQSSLESKKVVTEKNAPQIEVSPSVEDKHDEKDDEKDEDKEVHNGEKSPVDGAQQHAPLTTTTISATPPTL